MSKNVKKILVVEDNIELCSIIIDYLADQLSMYLLDVAYNGNDAVVKISQQNPDVILLDIGLANLNGLDVIRRINLTKSDYKPKFIIMSAAGNEGIIREAIRLGAVYYFRKPFKLKCLLEVINNLKL